jgi:hypothetical protein
MMNKADELHLLTEYLYNEYVEELFINETTKYTSMCYDVIKHDADERLGRELTDIEINFVKRSVIDKIKLTEKVN